MRSSGFTCGPFMSASVNIDQFTYDLYYSYLLSTTLTDLLEVEKKLEQAKKNYFVYTKGQDFYQNLKDKEYDDKRDSLISTYLKERMNKTAELDAIIDNYNISDYYNKNVDNYLEDQIDEYDELKTEKENTIGKSLTNDRRTYYSGLSNKNILKINNVIKILFIVLLVAYSILILFYRRLMINYNYIIIPVLLIAYILINNILHVSSKSY